MNNYRHIAYNIYTGEIICASTGNTLKRIVAKTDARDYRLYKTKGQWRFSHDFGKKWQENGFPIK